MLRAPPSTSATKTAARKRNPPSRDSAAPETLPSRSSRVSVAQHPQQQAPPVHAEETKTPPTQATETEFATPSPQQPRPPLSAELKWFTRLLDDVVLEHRATIRRLEQAQQAAALVRPRTHAEPPLQSVPSPVALGGTRSGRKDTRADRARGDVPDDVHTKRTELPRSRRSSARLNGIHAPPSATSAAAATTTTSPAAAAAATATAPYPERAVAADDDYNGDNSDCNEDDDGDDTRTGPVYGTEPRRARRGDASARSGLRRK